MTGALSPSHWVIILVVVLLLFGAKRLPDAARGLGRSMRILKAETTAMSADDPDNGQAPASPAPAVEPGNAPVPEKTAGAVNGSASSRSA